jgi:hypothetical protein
MGKHIGVVAGAAMAGLGILLAVASLAGFSVGLPPVEPATALSASWFMIAVLLMIGGTFVALVARGMELAAEESRSVRLPRPVRALHPTR